MRARIQLKRSLKSGLVVVTTALAVVSAIMLARALMLPERVPGQRAVFDFAQKSSLDYQVVLRQSPLYDEDVLGPGRAYFLNLVKEIQVKASYSLETAPATPVKCLSSLVGTLRVYDTSATDAVVLWERQHVLLQATETASEDGEVRLEKQIAVDLEKYRPVVDYIYELTDVKPARAALTLEWRVVARTGEGIPVAEDAVSTLVIPVAAKYFMIAGEPISEKRGSFTVSSETTDPAVIIERRIWGTVFGVSLSLLALLIFYTSVSAAEEKVRVLGVAVRKLGSRLVRLKNAELLGQFVLDVASVDDLARVADELGKPVLYVDADNRAVFCVVDSDTRYQYVVNMQDDSEIGTKGTERHRNS